MKLKLKKQKHGAKSRLNIPKWECASIVFARCFHHRFPCLTNHWVRKNKWANENKRNVKERNVLRKKVPTLSSVSAPTGLCYSGKNPIRKTCALCKNRTTAFLTLCQNESLLQPEEKFNLFNVSTLNLSRNREVDVTWHQDGNKGWMVQTALWYEFLHSFALIGCWPKGNTEA